MKNQKINVIRRRWRYTSADSPCCATNRNLLRDTRERGCTVSGGGA